MYADKALKKEYVANTITGANNNDIEHFFLFFYQERENLVCSYIQKSVFLPPLLVIPYLLTDRALKTVLFSSEEDHETELNLLCCYLCFFIVDDQGNGISNIINDM